jgi:hypothetical protein
VISLVVDTLTRHGQLIGWRGFIMSVSGDVATIAWVVGVAII